MLMGIGGLKYTRYSKRKIEKQRNVEEQAWFFRLTFEWDEQFVSYAKWNPDHNSRQC